MTPKNSTPRLVLLHVGIWLIALPLWTASVVTWWLEGVRAWLQTAIALEEANR